MIRKLLTLAALVIIPFVAVWTFAEVRWAVADPPSLLDAGAGPTVAAEPTPPPDASEDPSGFVSWAVDAFQHARQTGALFSWGILVAFGVLAAVMHRLKPKGDDKPSLTVAIAACAFGVVALVADVVAGAGHFAVAAPVVAPVIMAMFISPLVQRGDKAKEGAS